MRFTFLGKSGKLHEIDVRDRRVARVIRNLQHLPGQVLFQYRKEDGELRAISSEDVNTYLHTLAGEDVHGQGIPYLGRDGPRARTLRDLGPAETAKTVKANIVAAVDAAAARLGNTRAVCRKSYIHPAIFAGYESGDLCAFTFRDQGSPALDPDERWLLAYLSQTVLRPGGDAGGDATGANNGQLRRCRLVSRCSLRLSPYAILLPHAFRVFSSGVFERSVRASRPRRGVATVVRAPCHWQGLR